MSPASQTLRRRTTRPRRPRPVHSRNHQERPQEYKDRGAGGRRPLGRVGIMVVGAERRPRRLGDARREARLESCYRDPAMHSRWDDAEARRLEGLDLLVYASRLIGAETSLVVWGGGNTSIKTVERDHRRRDVADALRLHPDAPALVLERHGTITWGATVRDAYDATIELITRAEEAIAERKRGRRVFGGPRVPVSEPAARRAAALAAAPRLRGVLSRTRRVIVTF